MIDENSSALLVDLGGSVVEFSSSDPEALRQMRSRFAGFEVPSGRPEISFVHQPIQSNQEIGQEEGSFSTRIDLKNRKVYLFGDEGIDHVDGVLRVVLAAIAAPDLITHAALLVDGDRGFLCCGKPGAGKSTIAGLFPEYRACDELARVSVTPEGVQVKSLPYWEARPVNVSLESIFFLRHGTHNRRTRLSLSESMRELRRHLYWPLDEEEAAVKAFSTLSEVVGRVPFYWLDFLPDRRVWETLLGNF